MAFYNRAKVRLNTIGMVRSEMAVAYRAAVRGELAWADLRAAVAALTAIAGLDQGAALDERLIAVEIMLGTRSAPNGHAHRAVGRA